MRISAEAILVPRGSRSLTDKSATVTSETVDAFRPDEQTKAEARKAFERRGFTVHDAGMSLTIEGEPEAFERAFKVRVTVNREARPGEPVVTASGEPRVPDELGGLVEIVAFPKRAHTFDRPST